MREAANTILRYTAGKTIEDVYHDEVLRDALIRQFTVLGEAATRISGSLRARHPEISWTAIIGMRNVVVHQYDRVVVGSIWDAVTVGVPDLLPKLEVLIPPDPDGE
ncbi:MAG TPA: HepT-like ribonuclease domain-containing protein [Longimicrobiaceae bacterium]|nr:HepT-like ribonuclease domain-containing protein [Longimicrobiaceae bacterium]